MTIYDVKFYGAYYPMKRGHSCVEMSQSFLGRAGCKMPADVRFKATVLKEFKKKTDVLKLDFEDGSVEYETLFAPGYYYEDGTWHETKFRFAPDAFLKAYKDLVEKQDEKPKVNICDMTFYILKSNSPQYCSAFVSKEELTEDLIAGKQLYTARILKRYEGVEYVVKLEQIQGFKYVSLFSPDSLFNEKSKQWEITKVETFSSIARAILKCYIKYMNE